MKSYRLPMWWMLMLTVTRNYLRGCGEYELFVRGLIQEYLRYFRICWREWIFPATERASIVCINHNGAEEGFT